MAEPPEPKQPKREDYGVTGKIGEKQKPGADGNQPPETPDPKTPDDDDPRRTEREREPEKA